MFDESLCGSGLRADFEGCGVSDGLVGGESDMRLVDALKEREGIVAPEAIAESYWQLHRQPRNAWTHELDLRPWLETW